ncbi:hypothetical protein EON81_20800 [bacterium]|nr:MAG: hypothetical protein EON81_20800 [bacterium]
MPIFPFLAGLFTFIHFERPGDGEEFRRTTVSIDGRWRTVFLDTGMPQSFSQDPIIPSVRRVTLMGQSADIDFIPSPGFLAKLNVDLLIGRETISKFLLVNHPGRPLELKPRALATRIPKDAFSVPLGRDEIGAPLMTVEIDGVKIPLIVDTDADHISLSAVSAKPLLQIWRGQVPEPSTRQLPNDQFDAFTTFRSVVYQSGRMTLGGRTMGLNMSVWVDTDSAGPCSRPNFIGWDWLKTQTWVLDLTGNRLWFYDADLLKQ